ncbi:Tetratricopeptide TPR2 [Kalmanozyma brasiliensis GHG001]|uniref:ER membrane protein complex subunit 2 n=1 Tax=Kalmanozyma brasiliensis (strain GHG001) TaxID=1365824 RepID=V5EKG2_KALBG|nr:Tetratricopeptide TPR2 [Kalmanozyma brasiliensis GHG001]EST05385.1 Tetratricopeptide TPR2 [Kalmanozyma brasiliensis GHG001]
MATTSFTVSDNPETDPKAAAQWLAEQRRRPIRAPHKTVQYGELVITKRGLSSVSNEDLWSILEQVAIAAIELARFDLAELCISRLTSRFPNSQRVTALQGMLLEGKGDAKAAIELYEDVLNNGETSLILSRRRVAAIKSLGDIKGTVEALNLHLDTFYNDPEAWQELAEVYANQGMYAQSTFALEEVLLQVPQNSFFHLKYAETLYTNGEIAKAYKAYLRVLEMCQSDGESKTQGGAQGPWLRALWGTKMATTALIASPSSSKSSGSEEVVDQAKVKKIDELVTSLLLNKVYTPQAVSSKHLRDAARAVLAA